MLCNLMTSTPSADALHPDTAPDAPARVGVVMPILNEERHLVEAVDAVLGQDYPGPLHLVLALGPSQDRTDELAAELAARDPRVRTVHNP